MSLDHVSVGVADMQRSKAFYDAVLARLGIGPVMPVEMGGQLVGVGYGDTPAKPDFWIQFPVNGQPATQGNGVHVAFHADTRAKVDAFHAAAMKLGGLDEGAPGLRPHYHPSYYGAFVRDPDGNKIEACCHAPE
ncbi:MAG: glyoxalase/bleomycin resistance protein/dioxygenase [Alphaproteobacteria bacterium]|nr:MAG: glyoxalase/bleomycin resistance protein/dioxygenase [Caulobacteraceae bacterium]TPW07793.1 MAG: glyoxalase/bleomycin resistance protein/dioxygenase [Alphaproteobacteria bacterium]